MFEANKIQAPPDNDGVILDVVEGWKVKQYFNATAGRWYVTVSVNSPLARHWKRLRVLRSHYVYLRGTGTLDILFDHVVHHDNFDSRDDRFSNLVLLTSGEHDRLHREHAAIHGYPATFKGRKHRPETIEKMRQIAQARGNNDIWDSPKAKHFESTKELMSALASGEGNPAYRDDLDPVAITAYFERTGSLAGAARHFGCSVNAIRYRLEPKIYKRHPNPAAGRTRTYCFDDAEMADFYAEHGAKKAAAHFGCTEATIYYRLKAHRQRGASLEDPVG